MSKIIKSGSISKNPTDLLQGSTVNSIEDRSVFLRSEDPVTWDGNQLTFTKDIVLEIAASKDGSVKTYTIAAAQSPIALNNNESAYITIDRTTSGAATVILSDTAAIPNITDSSKETFILLKRIDTAAALKVCHLVLLKQSLEPGDTVRLGASGGAGGFVKIDYHDPISSSLPTGATVNIDGQAGVNGDLVLFSNLSANNNKIYKLDGVGTSITWQSTFDFNLGTPGDGDSVVVKSGNSFRDSIGIFDGTNWVFNDTVRYFNGSDYWEQSSLKTSSILASTTGDIFTVTAAGSENMIVDYSITTGSNKETGHLVITSDGVTAQATRTSANLTLVDINLFADISTSNIRLRYTNNTAFAGIIKYSVKRWSDTAGGPGGIPSYSGVSGSTTAAAGAISDIQYKGSSGNLEGDLDFQWDTTSKQLSIGGLKIDKLLGPLTLNDNQTTATTIISYNAAIYKNAIIEYSIERNGENRVGRLLVVNNGTVASITDSSTDTGGVGIGGLEIVFTATISGSNVLIQYITSATGFTAGFKYSSRRW